MTPAIPITPKQRMNQTLKELSDAAAKRAPRVLTPDQEEQTNDASITDGIRRALDPPKREDQ